MKRNKSANIQTMRRYLLLNTIHENTAFLKVNCPDTNADHSSILWTTPCSERNGMPKSDVDETSPHMLSK